MESAPKLPGLPGSGRQDNSFPALYGRFHAKEFPKIGNRYVDLSANISDRAGQFHGACDPVSQICHPVAQMEAIDPILRPHDSRSHLPGHLCTDHLAGCANRHLPDPIPEQRLLRQQAFP